jgi:hypothetical protein
MRHGLRAATIAITLLLAGCGYFNTMYNAQRRFRDAQRADARGDQATARAAYIESIEKPRRAIVRTPRVAGRTTLSFSSAAPGSASANTTPPARP